MTDPINETLARLETARLHVEALRSHLESLASRAPGTPYTLRQGVVVESWGRFVEGICDDTLHGSRAARERAERDVAVLHAAATRTPLPNAA